MSNILLGIVIVICNMLAYKNEVWIVTVLGAGAGFLLIGYAIREKLETKK